MHFLFYKRAVVSQLSHCAPKVGASPPSPPGMGEGRRVDRLRQLRLRRNCI